MTQCVHRAFSKTVLINACRSILFPANGLLSIHANTQLFHFILCSATSRTAIANYMGRKPGSTHNEQPASLYICKEKQVFFSFTRSWSSRCLKCHVYGLLGCEGTGAQPSVLQPFWKLIMVHGQWEVTLLLALDMRICFCFSSSVLSLYYSTTQNRQKLEKRKRIPETGLEPFKK